MVLNSPITNDTELDTYLFHIKNILEDLVFILEQQNKRGYTGSFNTGTNTIVVDKGIIVDVI